MLNWRERCGLKWKRLCLKRGDLYIHSYSDKARVSKELPCHYPSTYGPYPHLAIQYTCMTLPHFQVSDQCIATVTLVLIATVPHLVEFLSSSA